MAKKPAIPDAWDDDWESQADKAESTIGTTKVEQEVKITKAERLAKHAESNRKIWQNADEPETFHFLATREHVPLHSEFKPALKVLSRKPAPKLIQKIDPVTGLASLALEDEEEEREVKVSATPDELRLRAQREREQKQKRYDEVRARIMGTPSGNSSPGTITPPSEGGRGKGRGRGSSRNDIQRPSLQSAPRELFDPNSTKPGLPFHKKSTELSRSGSSTPREDDQIIRTPRGPDGGNGFVNRSGKGS